MEQEPAKNDVAITQPKPAPKKRSRTKRALIWTLQAIVLFGVIGAIFVFVPALSKMASRKNDSSNTANQSGYQTRSQTNSQSNKDSSAQNGPAASGTAQNGSGSASGGAADSPTNAAASQDGGEYAVSVYNVESNQPSGYLAVTLEISNPSKTKLAFYPTKQFKLVGLKTKQENAPSTPAGKQGLPTQDLLPGQTIKGVLYVKDFVGEDHELRFYPNIGSDEYSLVPLIAIPADQ